MDASGRDAASPQDNNEANICPSISEIQPTGQNDLDNQSSTSELAVDNLQELSVDVDVNMAEGQVTNWSSDMEGSIKPSAISPASEGEILPLQASSQTCLTESDKAAQTSSLKDVLWPMNPSIPTQRDSEHSLVPEAEMADQHGEDVIMRSKEVTAQMNPLGIKQDNPVASDQTQTKHPKRTRDQEGGEPADDRAFPTKHRRIEVHSRSESAGRGSENVEEAVVDVEKLATESSHLSEAEIFLQSMKDIVSPSLLSSELSRGVPEKHPSAPLNVPTAQMSAATLDSGSNGQLEANMNSSITSSNGTVLPLSPSTRHEQPLKRHILPNSTLSDTQEELMDITSSPSPPRRNDPDPSAPTDSHRLPVPGLWLMEFGLQRPDILEASINVNVELAEATRRWARRNESFDASLEHVSVHLMCLPKAQVMVYQNSLSHNTPMSVKTEGICSIGNVWPTPGPLLIELNNDKTCGDYWTSHMLPTTSTTLDITHCIGEGVNTLRLIHLSDLSEYVFVMYAARPNAEASEAAALYWRKKAFAELVVSKAAQATAGGSFVFPPPAFAVIGADGARASVSALS